MSAGTGIEHSKVSASVTEPLHLLQIWLRPDQRGHEPRYERKAIAGLSSGAGGWVVIASPDGRDGSLMVHQDATVLVGTLASEGVQRHTMGAGQHAWVQVIGGGVTLNA